MTNIGTKYILAQKFIFDPYSNTLSDLNNDNHVVRLGSNESRILLILIENSNQVVSRDQLHEYVWRDQGFQVDDSSLTQAISTLRKMLQDSTKSPQFVKTVPKRGYQLIAEVDISAPIKVPEENNHDKTQEPTTTLANNVDLNGDINIEVAKVTQDKQGLSKTKISLRVLLIWVLIIIAPIIAWVSHAPKSGKLTQIAQLDNAPLLIPANQQDLSHWLPIIERCAKTYQNHNETPIVKVIATSGSNESITLNYIHDLKHSDKNKTIVLFVDQTNYKSLCQ